MGLLGVLPSLPIIALPLTEPWLPNCCKLLGLGLGCGLLAPVLPLLLATVELNGVLPPPASNLELADFMTSAVVVLANAAASANELLSLVVVGEEEVGLGVETLIVLTACLVLASFPFLIPMLLLVDRSRSPNVLLLFSLSSSTWGEDESTTFGVLIRLIGFGGTPTPPLVGVVSLPPPTTAATVLSVDESLLDLGGVTLPLAGRSTSFDDDDVCSSPPRFTALSRCGFLLMDLAGLGGGLCLGVGGLDDAAWPTEEAEAFELEAGKVSPVSTLPPPTPGLLVPAEERGVVSASGCKSDLLVKFLTGLGGTFFGSLSQGVLLGTLCDNGADPLSPFGTLNCFIGLGGELPPLAVVTPLPYCKVENL